MEIFQSGLDLDLVRSDCQWLRRTLFRMVIYEGMQQLGNGISPRI